MARPPTAKSADQANASREEAPSGSLASASTPGTGPMPPAQIVPKTKRAVRRMSASRADRRRNIPSRARRRCTCCAASCPANTAVAKSSRGAKRNPTWQHMKSQIQDLLPTASHPKNTTAEATRAAQGGLSRKSTDGRGSSTDWSANLAAPRSEANLPGCCRAWRMATPHPQRSMRYANEAGRRRLARRPESFSNRTGIGTGLSIQRVCALSTATSTMGLYQSSCLVLTGSSCLPRRRYSAVSAGGGCTRQPRSSCPATLTGSSPPPVASLKQRHAAITTQSRSLWQSSAQPLWPKRRAPSLRKPGSV
mmetsp:Transcript_49614/g.153168  ORF Transcript_49614/g.153168 Transcript_49614/m.153168 type:complete len:308 (+) Transcript_49614:220-1143(+)